MTLEQEFIKVTNLLKKFGDFTAVDNLNFSIREGETFGLLGPNGAGKSTTISMICGLLTPDDGDITVAGNSIKKEPMAVKKVLGLVPQDIALYPTLSARENLLFWGRMYGLGGNELKERTEEVLEAVGLRQRAKEAVSTYSGGMKRRINIAAGIIHKPKILIMDEPTVGIDPQSRHHILETVKQLSTEGMTVIYTSHYMEEVEQLCDRIGIIDNGRLIAHGEKTELHRMVGDDDEIALGISGHDPDLVPELQAFSGVRGVTLKENNLAVLCSDGNQLIAGVLTLLNSKGVKVNSVNIKKPDLESLFLRLTGKALRD